MLLVSNSLKISIYKIVVSCKVCTELNRPDKTLIPNVPFFQLRSPVK